MRGKKLDLQIGAGFDEGWQLVDEETKETKKILDKNKHSLYIKKEKRRGKQVTVVGEFFLEKDELKKLLKVLKKSLATGGSIKENFIEIQGDVQDRLKKLLKEKNFRFKN